MKNIYTVNGDECIIETSTPKTGRLHFLIDTKDMNRVKALHWIPRRDSSGKFYAITSFRYKDSGKNCRACIQMHSFITSFEGKIIDHVDGDTQNNKASNLRVATAKQNCMNRGVNKNSKHNGKGFCFSKSENRFKAYIYLDGKAKSLGSWKTRDEAALAYNKAAIEHFGEFARLNEVSV